MLDISSLNKEQHAAVINTEGAMLVLAGAGTGKTRVITYRIAYLIRECGILAGNILAVTFTNKAAKEMKVRLHHLLGSIASAIHVGTFHSVCLNIIRTEAHILGIDGNRITVIDQDDRLALIKQLIKELGIDDKKNSPKKYLHMISEYKNTINYVEGKKPDDFIERFTLLFGRYEAVISSQTMLDFDDMLSKVVHLFLWDKEVLQKYRSVYKYILVDEYQDTNKLQAIFLSLIGAGGNICVVGDDDQSIYGWRGADIRNILDFDKEYKNVSEVKLVGNYRSSQKILDLANSLIEFNQGRRGKQLSATKSIDAEIQYKRLETEQAEAHFVVSTIKRLIEGGIDRGEIAILYRTNAQSRNFEVALNKEGVRYKVIGGISFYQRREIKDILSYLRLAVNPQDTISFRRSMKTPLRGIGDTTIDKIIAVSESEGSTLLEALDKFISMQKKVKNEVKIYADLFKELADIKSIKVMIDTVVERIGYRDYLKSEEDHDTANKKIDNVNELYSAAAGYEETVAELSLSDFLSTTSLQSSTDEDEEGAVKLLTIHASKGLEFEAVFLTGLENGLFPSSTSVDEGGLEEERRLCYVALTRAIKYLTLTSALERLVNGKRITSVPSEFIKQCGINRYNSGGKLDDNSEKCYDNKLLEDGRLKVADKVYHETFGEGVVLSVERETKSEDDKAKVHFKTSGLKTIVGKFLRPGR